MGAQAGAIDVEKNGWEQHGLIQVVVREEGDAGRWRDEQVTGSDQAFPLLL